MTEKLYTGSAVKAIDQLAIGEHGYIGLDLMTEAGEVAFKHICAHVPKAKSMLVLCGSGNNGGDGYVVASCALQAGWQVQVVRVSEPKTKDAQTVYQAYRVIKGSLITVDQFVQSDSKVDVVVDALLGVGLQGAPGGDYAAVIEKVIAIEQAARLSCAIVAIDVPSGVDADTGNVFDPHISAGLTVTYIANKWGLMTGPATSVIGKLIMEDLNVASSIKQQVNYSARLIEKPILSQRSADSHKGSFGHIAIAGGDDGMLGAILLAGQTALRCGSGKVHLLSTEQHLDKPALVCAELMSDVFVADDKQQHKTLALADAIAVGPGLGQGQWSKELFVAVLDTHKPLVVDADALTLLAGQPQKRDNWVLTPHPGEAASLLHCTTAQIQSNRLLAAQTIVQQYGGVCVLKGAGTLVADSQAVGLCNLGNPGMATAGMGDVLTGMVVSFMGQGMPLKVAAQTAVWLHSASADSLVENNSQRALIASDIIHDLAKKISTLELQK